MDFRRAAAALAMTAALAAAPPALDAQVRGQGRAGRGQAAQRGLTPADIQAQFDSYVINQAESVLLISDEQRPQFVRRVRALQAVRRQARVARNRLLAETSQLLRGRAEEARLAAATRAIDEHERNTLANVQKAYGAIDEVLTPWQQARFRVLEDRLEQKKLDMLLRAQQGPRR
ncbi:MAG TPA: hypothetical protein VFZ36_08170 [Vicinamibacterales bacterium]